MWNFSLTVNGNKIILRISSNRPVRKREDSSKKKLKKEQALHRFRAAA